MRRAEVGALVALGFLLVASAAWWALALWPPAPETPPWLERARQVCFNAAPGGLPDASGWLLLVGQPIGMFAVLMAIAGPALRSGLRRLAGRAAGRALLAVGVALLATGLTGAALRVAAARAEPASVRAAAGEIPPDTYPRLDRSAPELGLLDQRGERIQLDALRGRTALVTFAFGHCETVCPVVVKDCVEAQRRLRDRAPEAPEGPRGEVPRVLVVTLDPWRDTPSRLPHLAQHWKLGEDAHVLSGSVEEVEDVLSSWNVARRRDRQTGDVVHPPLVYVLDPEGRIAFASSGGAAALVELVERLRADGPPGRAALGPTSGT